MYAGMLKNTHQEENTLVSIPHITACSILAALSDCRSAIRKRLQHLKKTQNKTEFAVRSADRLLACIWIQKMGEMSVCCRES